MGDIMKKIDREYGTQDRKEVLYLIDNGIKYKFAKTYNDITTWKFDKTEKLFELLKEYYKNNCSFAS